MKKFISVSLALFILVSSLTFVNAFAYEFEDEEYNKNITYKYDKQNNILTFEGEGKLTTSVDMQEGGCKLLNNNDWDEYSKKVEKVVIGEGITEIGIGAFWRFSQLKTVVLPKTLKAIDDFVFYECYNLENIDLSDSVTAIGKEAFRSCRKLSKIYLGENLSKLGENNFLDCKNLNYIELSNQNKNFVLSDNGLYTANLKTLIYVNKNATSFKIDKNCTRIKRFAFNLSSVKKLNIPNTVKKVEGGAFYNSNIEHIAFSKKSTIKWLYDSATFYGDEIGERFGVFEKSKKLKTLVLPKTLKNIDCCMFLNCKSLTKVYLGENVKMIYGASFIGCKNLKKIILSKKNKNYKIYKNILYSKDFKTLVAVPAKLTKAKINSKTTTIGKYSFSSSKIKTVTIPKKVETIEYGAFYNCRNLKNVKFEKSSKLKLIGEPSDYSTSIDIGYEDYKKDSFYNYEAFQNCNKLKEVILPDSVVHMICAFSNCKNLKYIHFGKNFKGTNYWDENTVMFEVYGMNSLKKVSVSKSNKYFYTKNGKLYFKDSKTVAWKPKKKK